MTIGSDKGAIVNQTDDIARRLELMRRETEIGREQEVIGCTCWISGDGISGDGISGDGFVARPDCPHHAHLVRAAMEGVGLRIVTWPRRWCAPADPQSGAGGTRGHDQREDAMPPS